MDDKKPNQEKNENKQQEQISQKEAIIDIEQIEISEDNDSDILVITPLKTKIKKTKYCTSENAYKIFKDILQYEKYELKRKEHFWIMGIDREGYICCIYIVAIGGENFVKLQGIDIFDLAIDKKSKDIVIIHNHPGCKHPIPSENDINFTNKLYHACLQFGLRIIDHLIIGDEGCYSFEDSEMLLHIMEDYEYQPYHYIKEQLEIEKKEYAKIYAEEHSEEYAKKHIRENTEIIASNLLSSGIPIDIVMFSTGLSRSQVEEIKKTVESVKQIKKDL